MTASVGVVVATIGRPSLALLLAAFDGPPDRLPNHLVVVDDRRAAREPLPVGALSPALRTRLDVIEAGGRGAEAARNLGWRAARAEWIAFLDDDVIPCRGWLSELARDLDALAPHVGGSVGRVHASHPVGRAQRASATTRWAAPDVAYRASVLRRVGGFDERFAHAGREQTELGLRVRRAGLRVVEGRRTVVRPAWPTSEWARVRAQAAHADDALMRTLDGARWREAAGVAASGIGGHAAIASTGCVAAAGAVAGAPLVAAGGLAAWLAATATLAWRRITAEPRTFQEIGTIALASAAIPVAAVGHRLAGEWRAAALRRRLRTATAARRAPAAAPPPRRRDEAGVAQQVALSVQEAADRRLGAAI